MGMYNKFYAMWFNVCTDKNVHLRQKRQMSHTARASMSFSSRKQLGVLPSFWIVKSVLRPSGPPNCSLSQFPQHGVTRNYHSPLDGLQVHCKVTTRHFIGLPLQPTATHLYSWVESSSVGMKMSHPRKQHDNPVRSLAQSS